MGPGVVVHRRGEGAVAVAQQDRDVVVGEVADREVDLPVAVEVADGYRVRSGPGDVVHRRREGAVAVAQQDRDVVGSLVGDREVALPVAIEVANGYRARAGPRAAVCRRREIRAGPPTRVRGNGGASDHEYTDRKSIP